MAGCGHTGDVTYDGEWCGICNPAFGGDSNDPGDPGQACYCGGSGTVVSHGGGDFAVIRSCPVCGTGEKLADSLIPNVRSVR